MSTRWGEKRFQKATMAKFVILTGTNLVLRFILVDRDPEALRLQLVGDQDRVRVLDTAIFPMATTSFITVVISIGLALIGCRLGWWRLVAGYLLAVVWWCTGVLLVRQWEGNPNNKVLVLCAGLLLCWLAVANLGRSRSRSSPKTRLPASPARVG